MFVNIQFQFHKGTIKTQKILNMFNRAGIFQFHKGTIKTGENCQGSAA